MSRFLVNIVGPTAIGKTSLSIKIAQHFNTEILSADSRQFYREMSIGTAVPDHEELQAAPHHFIQHISIEDSYSVGDFERDALAKLEDLFQKHRLAVMVGGSGLYTKAVTEGLDEFPQVDPSIRDGLNQQLEANGIEWLQKKLMELDPNYYRQADVHNPHRLIRALEICMATGRPFSSFLNQEKKPREFKTIQIGLSAKREIIYDRTNRRVDLMMQHGLLDEARELYSKRHLNALNTVGYKELFDHFSGNIDLETAISEIKKNTRRFAKRQLTWFRKDARIHWFEYDEDPKVIIQHLQSLLTL